MSLTYLALAGLKFPLALTNLLMSLTKLPLATLELPLSVSKFPLVTSELPLASPKPIKMDDIMKAYDTFENAAKEKALKVIIIN